MKVLLHEPVVTLHHSWSYVKSHLHLLKKDLTSKTLTSIHYRNISLLVASTVAMVLAFFTPVFNKLAYALIIIITMIARLYGSKTTR